MLNNQLPFVKATTSKHEITLAGWTDKNIRASLSTTHPEPDLDLVHIRIFSEAPPPPMTLSLTHPLVGIHGFWRTEGDHSVFPSTWSEPFTIKATSQAPVCCFYSFSGENRLTVAFSNGLQTLTMRPGVHEETATLHCEVELFVEPTPALGQYEATLRIDTRALPYYESLDQVQLWWAEQPGYHPAFVPEVARRPMYSTWYSFHQQVDAARVEAQCQLAKEFGCEAVIMDDGWQTEDNRRGYAYTGDWEVAHSKIPDMEAHVARIHKLGMKYILWYSVPFVGIQSKAYARFADKLLTTIERLGAGVLDPRYPEVREYLIATYEEAILIWNVDGFKLDFVDEFGPALEQRQAPGQDYASVPAAVDRLLTDILARLQKIKPDVLVEFRQTYIGPLMRTYGNMFRAADSPNDALTNRIRTLNIRLLCGNTAAHADMLMWHKDDSVESAALQLINVLFAVPQISVLLDTLPLPHLAMVRYWLTFWLKHRDVLLDGKLKATHPETHYPVVLATTPEKRVVVVYQQDMVINPGLHLPEILLVVNGTLSKSIVLEFAEDAQAREMTISDCQGRQVGKQKRVRIKAGRTQRIEVPAAGVVTFIETLCAAVGAPLPMKKNLEA